MALGLEQRSPDFRRKRGSEEITHDQDFERMKKISLNHKHKNFIIEFYLKFTEIEYNDRSEQSD